MNQQIESQNNNNLSKNIFIIIVAVIIVTSIVGSGIYIWQKSTTTKAQIKSLKRINSLKNQLTQTKKTNNELKQQIEHLQKQIDNSQQNSEKNKINLKNEISKKNKPNNVYFNFLEDCEQYKNILDKYGKVEMELKELNEKVIIRNVGKSKGQICVLSVNFNNSKSIRIEIRNRIKENGWKTDEEFYMDGPRGISTEGYRKNSELMVLTWSISPKEGWSKENSEECKGLHWSQCFPENEWITTVSMQVANQFDN